MAHTTSGNQGRWTNGLLVLSLERCFAFFDDMGLPPRIVAEPTKAADVARDYLESDPTAKEDVLARVAARYDAPTAVALDEWFLHYILTDRADELFVWRELFRRLCHLQE